MTVAMLALAVVSGAESQETLSAAQRQLIISDLTKLLNQYYIFPDTSSKMRSHLASRLKKGDYDSLNDPAQFARRISEDLRLISKDLHLGFNYDPQQLRRTKQK